jgi:hypothetical protein
MYDVFLDCFHAVYTYIFRIFLSPSVKKTYVIQKNNFYSYMNPILYYNNYVLILNFLADDFRL